MVKKRDYLQEYKNNHSSPKKIAERSARNKARRKLGLKKGDGKEVDHKDGNPKNNSKSNMRVVSNKKAHRGQGGRMTKGIKKGSRKGK